MMPHPGQFCLPEMRSSNHGIECWLGPRAGLDRCRKSHPHLDSIPRTILPIENRSIDYAVLAIPTSKNVNLKYIELEHK
jgi:hypothetical protein